jgi:hypothetical protein
MTAAVVLAFEPSRDVFQCAHDVRPLAVGPHGIGDRKVGPVGKIDRLDLRTTFAQRARQGARGPLGGVEARLSAGPAAGRKRHACGVIDEQYDSRRLVALAAPDCARIEQEEGQNDEDPHPQTREPQPRAGRQVGRGTPIGEHRHRDEHGGDGPDPGHGGQREMGVGTEGHWVLAGWGRESRIYTPMGRRLRRIHVGLGEKGPMRSIPRRDFRSAI